MTHRRIFVLLMTALLTLPALSGKAQTPTARGIPAEDELAGLQSAVMRTFAPAVTSVTIDATPPSSDPDMSKLPFVSGTVVVREFDTDEHAASAYEQIAAGARSSLPAVYPGGTLESTDLPNVGSQATLIRMDYRGSGSEVWWEYAIVQRDRYVFFVAADASVFLSMPGSDDVDRSLPTVEIATAIASGEPSPEEPAFSEDGTSTGGLWGFMLPADDPLLAGLVAIHDSIIFPIPGR